MKRFEYIYSVDFDLSNPYIESALLQDREILEVYLDGIGRSEIITSGVPTGQQVLYEYVNKLLKIVSALSEGSVSDVCS